MNAPTLYGITAEMNAILALIEDGGGELTPELEQALTITEGQFAAKAEKDRLANLQKFYENAQKRLADAISSAMQAFGHDKVENGTLRLSLRHTTATEVDDIDQVPQFFKTTKVETVADKTAIKKAIQDGIEVPGAHLVENVSLQIK